MVYVVFSALCYNVRGIQTLALPPDKTKKVSKISNFIVSLLCKHIQDLIKLSRT